MFLAWKEMKYLKGRYLLIISVIALISYLVYFLTSLAFGLARSNRTSIDYWEAGGVILSSSANESITASVFDKSLMEEINYERKEAINVAPAVVYRNGSSLKKDQINMVFLGVKKDSELIPALIVGRMPTSITETVVSETLKKQEDLELGDTLEVAKTGRVFEIVGFTESSQYNTAPVAYVNLEMASQAMMLYTKGEKEYDAVTGPTPKMPDRISGIVVKGTQKLEELPEGLEWISIEDFIKKIPGYQAQVLTFGLMICFLTGISAVIVGIFLYILTIQKKTVFGVLKAQGISNQYITKAVATQTGLVTIAGLIVGFLINVMTITVLPDSVPVASNLLFYMIISLITLACAFAGSMFSIRAVSKIDPLDAM